MCTAWAIWNAKELPHLCGAQHEHHVADLQLSMYECCGHPLKRSIAALLGGAAAGCGGCCLCTSPSSSVQGIAAGSLQCPFFAVQRVGDTWDMECRSCGLC